MGVENWAEEDRKRASIKVARFLADYFRTQNSKFSKVFDVDSIYLRVPSTIQQKGVTDAQFTALTKKLLLFSKTPIISYTLLFCIETPYGWDFRHDEEFGALIENESFKNMLRMREMSSFCRPWYFLEAE